MRRSIVPLSLMIVAIAAVIVYWRTAFPNISWWENGELAAAASVLGVVHPPGSLIPTIVGWLFLQLPLGFSPAFQLNVAAGIVSAGVAVVTLLVGLRLAGGVDKDKWLTVVALVTVGLAFAFSRTVWYNGTVFNAYIFTALLTATILWTLLRWWEAAGGLNDARWLFLLCLLIGLDLSVHRTNALLVPGIALIVWMRSPRILLSWRSWLTGAAGLALGLSFFLILMPMAASHPAINANNPSTFSAFWDYLTVKQYGGGFLVNLYPRNGNFWSDQVMDYLTGFFANFANTGGPLGVLGVLPIIFGVVGIFSVLVRDTKLGVSLLILFLCASLGAIIYFNVPAHYFRAMDRHYLPSFVIFGMFMIVGVLAAVRWLQALTIGRIGAGVYSLLLVVMTAAQLTANYAYLNNSANSVPYDTGRNILDSTPQNAILIVAADADTFPIWYLQTAEHVRPDVTVLNVSLLNTAWYVRQMQTEDTALGIALTDSELTALGPGPWTDTTIAIPLARSFTGPDGATIDTAHFHFPPTLQDGLIMGHDALIRRILCGNAWRRPVYISSFVLGQLGWLIPYGRGEGIVRQIMPYEGPGVDVALCEKRLLSDYAYRGFADTSLTLDPMTKGVGRAYWGELCSLLASSDDIAQRLKWRDQLQARIPLERLDAEIGLMQALDQLCNPPAAAR